MNLRFLAIMMQICPTLDDACGNDQTFGSWVSVEFFFKGWCGMLGGVLINIRDISFALDCGFATGYIVISELYQTWFYIYS